MHSFISAPRLDLRRRALAAVTVALLAAVMFGLLGARGASAASTTHVFPSSTSSVVGSVGFIDADEVGFFWSVARGDRVSESFTGPNAINRAILNVEVIQNVLAPSQQVNWDLELNSTVVGSFVVPAGTTGPVTVDVSFPTITGPNYNVTNRVTNEVPFGGGSHTLAYAGSGAHSIQLISNEAETTADCKNGGWQSHTDAQGNPFKNQGDCVSYIATKGKNPAAG